MQGWGVRVSHEASRAGFGNSRSSLEGLSLFPGGEPRAVAQRLQPFSPLLLVSGCRELGRVAAAGGGPSGGRWARCTGLGPGECASVRERVWGQVRPQEGGSLGSRCFSSRPVTFGDLFK